MHEQLTRPPVVKLSRGLSHVSCTATLISQSVRRMELIFCLRFTWPQPLDLQLHCPHPDGSAINFQPRRRVRAPSWRGLHTAVAITCVTAMQRGLRVPRVCIYTRSCMHANRHAKRSAGDMHDRDRCAASPPHQALISWRTLAAQRAAGSRQAVSTPRIRTSAAMFKLTTERIRS